MKKLKIGLIVDNPELPQYLHELLKFSSSSNNYIITHLIVYDFSLNRSKLSKIKKQPKIILRYIDAFFFRLLSFFEGIIFKSSHLKGYDKCIGISNSYNLEILKIAPIISSSGFVYRFSSDDISLLKQQNFDCMIRCGSGILQGEILRAAKYGILSFHHGNNDIYRGGPSGFWEVYNEEKETGFIIQQLTDKLDGGKVLVKGAYQTQWYFKLNQANVIFLSIIHLHNLLNKIAIQGWDSIPEIDSVPYYNRLYTIPKFWQTLYYSACLFFTICTKIVNRILGVRITWGIAYGRGDIFQADFRKSSIISYPKRKGFIADPFLITQNGKQYIFCEELLFSENKGVISIFEFDQQGKPRYMGRVLEEPFHLSFPFVFQDGGKYYMLPECHQANQIRLYESENFPFKWKLSCVLIDEISAADPLLFKHDNYWWLIFSTDSAGTNCQNSELHVYYSENLLSNDWRPHASNPVLFTTDGARNAGSIISHKGNKYRVGQTHGIDVYGESIIVSEIKNLTPTIYKEQVVFRVKPHFFKAIHGTHHLDENDGVYVIDFQRKLYFKYS